VLAREERNGERRLVGYVAAAPEAVEANDLRAFLGRQLPEHMVPAAWVFLPALPLNRERQGDRAALGRIAPAVQVADADGAIDPVVSRLAAIFGEVLGSTAWEPGTTSSPWAAIRSRRPRCCRGCARRSAPSCRSRTSTSTDRRRPHPAGGGRCRRLWRLRRPCRGDPAPAAR